MTKSIMKALFFLGFLLISVNVQSLSLRFEGDPINGKEVVIQFDEKYRVKECKKWLLVDVHKYNSSVWLEIDGVLELSESTRLKSKSHFLRGKFTYSTSDHPQEYVAIIHPDSVVYLRGASDANILVYEYEWFERNSACRQ